MKTVAIIQARMGSTRLPGKVIKTLCGKTVLEHVIERVKGCRLLDEVVIATTVSPADDAIVKEAERCGVKWFRGSEEDVLERYYLAAKEYEAEVVVRVTSDCPLFDPTVLTEMLDYFNSERSQGLNIDYLSNTLTRSYPRGLDAEVFTFSALERAFLDAVQPYEREHVTPYIYQHPELFSLHGQTSDEDHSAHRWTLDTEEDFRLIEEIYFALYKENKFFTMEHILELLKQRPELARINVHVEQKKLGI